MMMGFVIRVFAGTDQNVSAMAVLVLLVIALGLYSVPVRRKQ